MACACSSPATPVAVPAPAAAGAAVCAQLDAALPDVVNGQPARRTAPESPLTAAWGYPSIVLRCGVGRPAALQPTSTLESVNEVDWFREETADATRFTTTGRSVNVEVVVPDAYAPAVNPLVDLAGPVTRTVPLA
jgi:hypothetical protein